MSDKASITSESKSELNGAGQAGALYIKAGNSVQLTGNSNLTTRSLNAGGGNISIEAVDLLYLLESSITTSAILGGGNGGDIDIDPMFVVLNHGTIQANASGGSGGNITVSADYFITSPDSIIEATSLLSTPGQISIQAMKFNPNRVFGGLDVNLLDADRWARTPCTLRTSEDTSRLILEGKDAIPTPIDDFLPGLPALLNSPIPAPFKNPAQPEEAKEPGMPDN